MPHSTSTQEKFAVMVLSWLVPGYGFFHNGHRARGIFFFVILTLTFIMGSALQASILLPEGFSSKDFNLVAVLTSVTQLFSGALGIVSFLPELFGAKFAILPYNEVSQWSDLGSFYLLVSGGMNYFLLVNTYDQFYGHRAKLVETVEGTAEKL